MPVPTFTLVRFHGTASKPFSFPGTRLIKDSAEGRNNAKQNPSFCHHALHSWRHLDQRRACRIIPIPFTSEKKRKITIQTVNYFNNTWIRSISRRHCCNLFACNSDINLKRSARGGLVSHRCNLFSSRQVFIMK